MKISLDELFLYRQYTNYPMEFYYDKKEKVILPKEYVKFDDSSPFERFIPLFRINQENIEMSFIIHLNDKKLLSQYKKRNVCFEEFLQINNLYSEWWNYYKNAVFDIIIKWCDENRIHYEEQSKT